MSFAIEARSTLWRLSRQFYARAVGELLHHNALDFHTDRGLEQLGQILLRR